jgi:NadR type nicotinamide-nucleotide adenylyltransferase
MTLHIVLHGAESVGKSTLTERLGLYFSANIVPEYGREYCAQHGTDNLDVADLIAIMDGHIAATQVALAGNPPLLISDTDPLMTAAWAMLLLGQRVPELDAFADVANFYLVPAPDVPWVDDGLRMHAAPEQRQRLHDLAIAELERRDPPYQILHGDFAVREAQAIATITALIDNSA